MLSAGMHKACCQRIRRSSGSEGGGRRVGVEERSSTPKPACHTAGGTIIRKEFAHMNGGGEDDSEGKPHASHPTHHRGRRKGGKSYTGVLGQKNQGYRHMSFPALLFQPHATENGRHTQRHKKVGCSRHKAGSGKSVMSQRKQQGAWGWECLSIPCLKPVPSFHLSQLPFLSSLPKSKSSAACAVGCVCCKIFPQRGLLSQMG